MTPAFARDVFIDSRHMDTELSAGFGQDHPLTFKLNPDIIRSIGSLLFPGGPSAILRRIRAIVVWPTVNAVLRRWTATHISQEVVKRVKPAIADCDATDIAMGVVALRIKATVLEFAPSAVFRAGISASGFAMGGHGCTGDLFAETATRLRDPVLKARTGNGFDGAAITAAFPKCRVTSSTLHHCPASKTLSCKILTLHACYIRPA